MRPGIAGLAFVLLLAGCGQADWGMDRHGAPVTAEALQGRWLVINYWASWCRPCRKEVPELNALDASREDVVVLGVNFDGLQGAALNAAAEQLGIRFRVLAEDPSARLGLARQAVLPASVLVGPDGQVRAQLVGEQTVQSLTRTLAKLGADAVSGTQGRTNQ